MRKKICEIPDTFIPCVNELKVNAKILTKTYCFELITPLFGGDHESWKLDLKRPVREQSVKGQLRFWWRAMQGEENNKILLDLENNLWGGVTEKYKNGIKSKVSIYLSDINVEEKKLAEMKNKYSVNDDLIPTCVLFPVTKLVKDNDEIYFISKMNFKLKISYPEKYEKEIINTLKLFTLFGGVGARTRRGTGSLYCRELLEDFETESDILHFVQKISSGREKKIDYPRLKGIEFYCNELNGDDPHILWKSMLESYGSYRQDRAKKQNSNMPGRSYWPEPDSIRTITGQKEEKHSPEHPDVVDKKNPWFPRTAFGLPILMKFKDQKDPGGGKECSLTTDIGTGERFPSPVILKVIKLPNGKIFKCAVVLNQKFPESIRLKVPGFNNNRAYSLKKTELPFHENYQNKTMRKKSPLNGKSIYEDLAFYLNLNKVEPKEAD